MITLKNVMRANAASCIIFALIFLLKPSEVAVYLGGDTPAPNLVLLGLGAVLIVNGFHLLWVSSKPLPSQFLILYFSIADFVWVLVSISAVIMGVWITTASGIAASYIVALMVAVLGILQIKKRSQATEF